MMQNISWKWWFVVKHSWFLSFYCCGQPTLDICCNFGGTLTDNMLMKIDLRESTDTLTISLSYTISLGLLNYFVSWHVATTSYLVARPCRHNLLYIWTVFFSFQRLEYWWYPYYVWDMSLCHKEEKNLRTKLLFSSLI